MTGTPVLDNRWPPQFLEFFQDLLCYLSYELGLLFMQRISEPPRNSWGAGQWIILILILYIGYHLGRVYRQGMLTSLVTVFSS